MGVASLGFRIKICLNGNNPAPDPYVAHITHRAPPEQQPTFFLHWRERGRQGRRARACKSGLKNQNMYFWVLLLLLALLSHEWLGELRFLWRLPGSPFLLLLGAVCLALCGVLFLEPSQTSAGL